MDHQQIVLLSKTILEDAISGKRILLTGDSFLIGVMENYLITKIVSLEENVGTIGTYKPSLNMNFKSGGQIVVIDFNGKIRGLNYLEYLDSLDQVICIEVLKSSFEDLYEEYLSALIRSIKNVNVLTWED